MISAPVFGKEQIAFYIEALRNSTVSGLISREHLGEFTYTELEHYDFERDECRQLFYAISLIKNAVKSNSSLSIYDLYSAVTGRLLIDFNEDDKTLIEICGGDLTGILYTFAAMLYRHIFPERSDSVCYLYVNYILAKAGYGQMLISYRLWKMYEAYYTDLMETGNAKEFVNFIIKECLVLFQ